jgi:hypothetical protein
VAVFGAIANTTVGADALRDGSIDAGRLTTAVQHIFLGIVVVSVLMAVMVTLLPRGDRPRTGEDTADVPAETAA